MQDRVVLDISGQWAASERSGDLAGELVAVGVPVTVSSLVMSARELLA